MKKDKARLKLARPLATLIASFCLAQVSMAAAGSAGSLNICSNPEARKVIENKESFLPLADLSKFVADKKLILIGEIHYTQLKLRPTLMKTLAETLGSGSRVCLFHEMDAEASIEQHMKAFEGVEGYEDYNRQTSVVYNEAKNLGWSQITVDGSSDILDDSIETVNRRDQEMAGRIRKALGSRCDQAMMFVGKAHLGNEVKGRRNLAELLKKAGVATLTVNMQDSADDRMAKIWKEDAEMALTSMSWKGVCAKGQSLSSQNEARLFLNQKLPRGMRVYPRAPKPDLTVWDSFDLTILAEDPSLH